MGEVTRILSAIDQGDSHAAEQLLPLVYDELRALATHKLNHETPGQTLQPTALVHEAYLRLIGDGSKQTWQGRGHFFAAAAEAMRRILVENARRKRTLKHGAGHARIEVEPVDRSTGRPIDLLALDEALTRFAAKEPEKSELVKLRFFAGMTMPEAAAALGISIATAERHWAYARAWLFAAVNGEPSIVPPLIKSRNSI
jgi:RNA polymerase sigma factor (TIGR02999 family)